MADFGLLSQKTADRLGAAISNLKSRLASAEIKLQTLDHGGQRNDLFIAMPLAEIAAATVGATSITPTAGDAKIYHFRSGVLEQLYTTSIWNTGITAVAANVPIPVHREWTTGKFVALLSAGTGGATGDCTPCCCNIGNFTDEFTTFDPTTYRELNENVDDRPGWLTHSGHPALSPVWGRCQQMMTWPVGGYIQIEAHCDEPVPILEGTGIRNLELSNGTVPGTVPCPISNQFLQMIYAPSDNIGFPANIEVKHNAITVFSGTVGQGISDWIWHIRVTRTSINTYDLSYVFDGSELYTDSIDFTPIKQVVTHSGTARAIDYISFTQSF